MQRFDRISIDFHQMGGAPCILHLRIPVATVVGLLGEGLSPTEVLADYPDLEAADIAQALAFAAETVRERQIPLLAD